MKKISRYFRVRLDEKLDGPITEENVEKLLDAGLLEVAISHGKWWRLRRGGMTKRWKRKPGEFRIPTKAGLKAFGAITHKDFEDA